MFVILLFPPFQITFFSSKLLAFMGKRELLEPSGYLIKIQFGREENKNKFTTPFHIDMFRVMQAVTPLRHYNTSS